MPILTYESIDEVQKVITERQKPLALYIFSENKAVIKKLTSEIAYGGGCINDTIIHIATSQTKIAIANKPAGSTTFKPFEYTPIVGIIVSAAINA